MTDYNRWVAKKDEMWMTKIASRLKGYATTHDMLADFDQLLVNARAYNTPGHGEKAWPDAISYAQQVVDKAQQVLNQHKQNLSHWQHLAEVEEAGGLAPAAPAAEADNTHWIECTRCNKWRIVSDVVQRAHEDSGGEEWCCDDQFDRAVRGCHLPADG